MSKTILHIGLLFILLSSCAGVKNAGSNAENVVYPPNPAYISAFHEGIRLKLKGRNDEAVAKFEKCLAISKADPAVYYALAQIANEADDFTEAQMNLEKAHELDASNIWYTYELAQLAIANEDYQGAVEYLKELIESDQRNTEWHFMLAEAYIRSNDVQKGIDTYDKVQEITGLIPGLSIQKSHLYQSINKNDEALEELSLANIEFPRDETIIGAYVDYYYKVGDIDKVSEYIELLIDINPGSGQAQLSYAEILLSKNKKAEALKALELVFKDVNIPEVTKIEIVLMLKDRYKTWLAAKSSLSQILVDMYPDNASANSLYGDVLIEKNENLEALSYYQKSVKIDGSSFAVWNQVVLIEYQLGLYDQLYRDSKACLELFPSVTSVYLLSGIACNELGKFEEAIEILESGLVYVIEENQIHNEIYGELGTANYGIGSYKSGDDYFEKALKNSSGNLLRYNYAVSLLKTSRKLDLASTLVSGIRESSPKNLNYLLLEAKLNIKLKNFETAKNSLEKALVDDPRVDTNADFCELLGDAYILLKDKEKGLFYWRLAIQNKGESPLLLKKINDERWYEE